MLRTNVRPWVLVGDTLVDRPGPYAPGVGQGFLFHDSATGDCSVLSVEPSTQVHTWEPFCCGESGCSGGSSGLALLKWHGVAAQGTLISNATLNYVSDGPGPGDEFIAGGLAAKYPLVSARTGRNFAVNLITNPGNVPLVFLLIVNGNFVTPAAVLFMSAPAVSISAGPFEIPAQSTIDVAFAASGIVSQSNGVVFSSTLELS